MKFLHWLILKLAQAIFFLITEIWCFHVKNSSSWMPTNLKLFVLQSSPYLSKVSFPIFNDIELFKGIFLALKIIYFVFEMFSVSLLHLNHSEALVSSSFRQENNSSRFLPFNWKVVSSANNKTFRVGVARSRSLISKRKRSEPSTHFIQKRLFFQTTRHINIH